MPQIVFITYFDNGTLKLLYLDKIEMVAAELTRKYVFTPPTHTSILGESALLEDQIGNSPKWHCWLSFPSTSSSSYLEPPTLVCGLDSVTCGGGG